MGSLRYEQIKPDSNTIVLGLSCTCIANIPFSHIVTCPLVLTDNPYTNTGQSKMANILFSKGLADRMKDKGSNIVTCSVHPGVIKTNLWRSTGLDKGIFGFITGAFVMDKSIPQGTATTLFACLSPRMQSDPAMSGAYLSDCSPIAPNEEGCDITCEGRNKLWEATSSQLKEALHSQGLPVPASNIFFPN